MGVPRDGWRELFNWARVVLVKTWLANVSMVDTWSIPSMVDTWLTYLASMGCMSIYGAVCSINTHTPHVEAQKVPNEVYSRKCRQECKP